MSSSSVGGAAHGGDLGAERLRDLHSESPHSPGCPIDQHPLTGRHRIGIAQAEQSCHPGQRHRGGLLEGKIDRLSRQKRGGCGDVLRKGS